MKTILLVDDNDLLIRTYSMALRQWGYHVIEADSGSAGFALARKHLPDLTVSDIDMPGGDGANLLRSDFRSFAAAEPPLSSAEAEERPHQLGQARGASVTPPFSSPRIGART